MSWGDTFRSAYAAARDKARKIADQALTTVENAAAVIRQRAARIAQQVRDTASAAARQAIAATKLGVAIAEELAVNLPESLSFIAAAYSIKAYTAIRGWFSETNPPAGTLVIPCRMTDKARIYTAAYRRSLVNSKFAGADTPALRDAMTALARDNPVDVERHLETIAKARQRPLEQIRGEYQRFRELQQQQRDKIKTSNGTVAPIDALNPEQADFMGSTWQLRYGKIVGDALDIDPVFAALLNPTGGLVGPGNKGLAPDAWYMPEAIAYHGAYHDATGYLYNYHNQGPGYNYMNSPFGLPTSNPLAGQMTGIAEWSVNTIS